jgi:hypothetical protein
MNTYLITYGADNDKATFEADSPAHAVEQFIDWAPVSDDEEASRASIESVSICIDVDATEDGVGYANCMDGSYFGLDELVITFVPQHRAQDGDDVEEYLFRREDPA